MLYIYISYDSIDSDIEYYYAEKIIAGLDQHVSTFRSRTEHTKFRIIYHYLHLQAIGLLAK